MEHWDLSSLAVEPHHPAILHSARGEARSILISLPAGEQLQDHQVHERAYVVVVDGELYGGSLADAGEFTQFLLTLQSEEYFGGTTGEESQ